MSPQFNNILYCTILQSLFFKIYIPHKTIISGNILASAIPKFKLALSATIPTSQGPNVQPASPQSANAPNITAPPFLKFLAPSEYKPGQEILTVNPQRAQPISAITGIWQIATVK